MNALITGASKGLGLGLCTVLASRGDGVFAACRKVTPELAALGVRVIEGVEVTSQTAIQKLREGIGQEPVDLVVCNAGINISFNCDGIETLDIAAVNQEYQVNALGSLRTVQAALPNLRQGSKIIFVSTTGNVLGRNPPRGGSYGYRMSKAGINTFGFLLAKELQPRGIAVRMISPGAVNTDLLRAIYATGRVSARAPEESPDPVSAARVMLAKIDELTIDSTGSWVDETGKSWA